jgi:predicted negative regulator of RcsB-dependent stress response
VEIYETEQERVEAFKKWWEQNGKYAIAAVVVILAGVFGWRQWQGYQENQASAASDVYQKMLDARDPAKVIEAGRAVVAQYPGSEYAALASLEMAAAAVAQNDLDGAAAHLRFALDNGKAPGDKQVAALRLARVLLAQQKGKEALQVLDGVKPEGFEGDFEEVRGDIALAAGDRVAARDAYQKAVTNYGSNNGKARLAQMKLDDLSDAVGGAK